MGTIEKGTLIRDLEVIDIDSEGRGVGRTDQLVVFVEGAVPGDVVNAVVYNRKKNYCEARVAGILTPSPYRTTPRCIHFGICGGCKWQHLNYEKQLYYKQKQVEDALTRIGTFPVPELRPIRASSKVYQYRNKLEFSFSNAAWSSREEMAAGKTGNQDALGFHVPGRFDKVLDISICHLQDDLNNRIRNEVRDFTKRNGYPYFDLREQTGWMRNLLIRSSNTGEWMVLVVFHDAVMDEIHALMSHLRDRFPEITSLLFAVNTKRNDSMSDLEMVTFSGRTAITEVMEGLTFRISAKSFFQTNSDQAYELYKIVRDFAELRGNETVYDLYSGTGTIANFVSAKAGKVIGIEFVNEAVRDAMENSGLNGIKNTRFFAGDMKSMLNERFFSEQGKPDVIITDPPRAGMPGDVARCITSSGAVRIVYVSCNPSTQARDLNILCEKYVIKAVQPVDMFPHTTHVENVVLLTLQP